VTARAPSEVAVTAKDLPLHCPTPAMQVWNQHPRVFLDVVDTGSAQCPYCGTRYIFQGAPAVSGH
jgi:uncharacterized Zn-finger protein